MMADHDPNGPPPVPAAPPPPAAPKPSAWLRLTLGVLPDPDNDQPSLDRLARVIGEAFGPWTMIYGMTLEPITPPDRADADRHHAAKVERFGGSMK